MSRTLRCSCCGRTFKRAKWLFAHVDRCQRKQRIANRLRERRAKAELNPQWFQRSPPIRPVNDGVTPRHSSST